MKHIVWLSPIIYFSIAWLYPWDKIQWDSTISISYLFDILFCVISLFVFKLRLKVKGQDLKGATSRIIAIVGIASFSLFLVNISKFPAPFKYIEQLFLQILILAPIVEEFIFRFAIFGATEKYFKNKNHLLLSNSLLFSISHAPGIFMLPSQFHGFIYIQLGYTFLLGWICSKARLKTGSIIEPIIIHFVFNLLFYIAVIQEVI